MSNITMEETIEIDNEEEVIDFQLDEGTTVKVAGPDGNETDDEFEVIEVSKVIVGLRNLDTGEKDRAHPSRITCMITDQGIRVDNPFFMTKLEDKPKPRAKTAPKKKEQKAEPLDFNALREYGELWSKPTNFDHDMKSEAHCLIANDGSRFWVFNTYDGSLGKKATGAEMPPGKEYMIKDEAALKNKIKQLRKKEYSLRFEDTQSEESGDADNDSEE